MLPHGLGKTVRVLVFAEGEAAKIAEDAGADYVADDEMIALVRREEGDCEEVDGQEVHGEEALRLIGIDPGGCQRGNLQSSRDITPGDVSASVGHCFSRANRCSRWSQSFAPQIGQ